MFFAVGMIVYEKNQKPSIGNTLEFFFFFLQLHLRHMEVPGLEAEWELQLQTYTTATVALDLSHICDLHLSLQQHQILNPLSEGLNLCPHGS